jgi:hypothetical protein
LRDHWPIAVDEEKKEEEVAEKTFGKALIEL